MGIKGIYKEIGPGQRISISKLAATHLERHGRPLRLAIDVSIWQFQIQAGRGGANPATRTLFYRLARLLGLGIQPLFVFDGPEKPTFKRGHRSTRRPGTSVLDAQTKLMLRLFGFAAHDAPGEAEAECALLQRCGVVDAVLSEDVDTLMFGCGRTLRNWTAEGSGSATPTHVSVYDVGGDDGKEGAALTREGMVLVALMSGGDYLPEGVPGCGVKVACEAARAGFGAELCAIKAADWEAGAARWRERLRHELVTNESGFFRTRHKVLAIPESFPSLEILRYYTHPVVSRMETVDRLKKELASKSLCEVDVAGLRNFVGDNFDWTGRIGAIKFIRVLAPHLMVPKLLGGCILNEGNGIHGGTNDELALIKTIGNRRTHFSTDAMPELRLSFIPADVVGMDPNDEPEDEIPSTSHSFGRNGLALNSDDEFEAAAEADDVESSLVKPGSSKTKPFDPFAPCLVWIPETVVRRCAPFSVEAWEEKQEARLQKKTAALNKSPRKTRAKKDVDSTMPKGALDRFFRVTKRKPEVSVSKSSTSSDSTKALEKTLSASPELSPIRTLQNGPGSPALDGPIKKASSSPTKARNSTLKKGAAAPTATNPWALAAIGSQRHSHSPPAAPRITKAGAAASQHLHSRKGLTRVQSAPPLDDNPSSPDLPPLADLITGGKTGSKRHHIRSPAPTRDLPSLQDEYERGTSPPPRVATGGSPYQIARTEGGEQQSGSPARRTERARPFKRSKSGNETLEEEGTTGFGAALGGQEPPNSRHFTQTSIEQAFALSGVSSSRAAKSVRSGIVRAKKSQAGTTKAQAKVEVETIEIFSSDDENDTAGVGRTASDAYIRQRSARQDKERNSVNDDPFREKHCNFEQSPDDGAPPQKSGKTRLYIPRTSLDGFFKTVEVTREEATRWIARQQQEDETDSRKKGARPGRARMYRESDVQVLDLTGED